MAVSHQNIRFHSAGTEVAGVLSTPEGMSDAKPLVIMAGGWCYTKEIVMPHYAKYFHDIGCATLRFDYRNFGESKGEPRQHVDPWAQIEDYRNALSFARSLKQIDQENIGIWGISYSGGHVMAVAAIDSRPRFVISTIPVIDGFQTMRRCHGEARFVKLNKLLADDRESRFRGSPGAYMAMSPTQSDAEMSTWPFPHVYAGFMPIKEREAPLHEHRNTVHSTELLLQYNVIPYCARIVATPVLMTLAAGDNITSADLEVQAYNSVASPNKKFVSVEGVEHMSLYTNNDHLGKVGRVQAKWLKNLLSERD